MNDWRVKRDILLSLRPMIELFDFKRSQMKYDAWVEFVQHTKLRILSDPKQFIAGELPSLLLMNDAIESIFSEYMDEELQLQ